MIWSFIKSLFTKNKVKINDTIFTFDDCKNSTVILNVNGDYKKVVFDENGKMKVLNHNKIDLSKLDKQVSSALEGL